MKKVLDKLDHFEKSLNDKFNILLGKMTFLIVLVIAWSILVCL